MVGLLESKVALVTGGGSGIGRAVCELARSEGARLVVVDLDPAAADETVAALDGGRDGDRDGDTVAVAGDVADPDVWERAIAAAAGLGGLDLVHLNAGVYGYTGPIDELPLDVYQRTLDANVSGVVLGTRAAVGAMRGRGGAIVVTASAAGIVAFEPNPLYTLTKQAVAGFVRAVAPGLAPDGISVDAVCPGVVDTPMTVEAMGGGDPHAVGLEMIAPADIAEQVLALALSEGTGRCRAVRERKGPVDWTFPTWRDLASA
jgi:NAD(P)-dependent dehydrogenase (short-subunit alcohol dehydrogenase family)